MICALILPVEMFLYIMELCSTPTVVRMMVTCSRMHTIATRRLYTVISVSGIRARRLFGTLVSGGPRSQLYSQSVRRLRWESTAISDRHLSYPIFCDALLRLTGLYALTIIVPISPTPLLLHCMRRARIIRDIVPDLTCARLYSQTGTLPPTPIALPMLNTLRIGGSAEISDMLCYRKLWELAFSAELSYLDIEHILKNMRRGFSAALKTLRITVKSNVDICSVLHSFAEYIAGLETLCLDQYLLDATVSAR